MKFEKKTPAQSLNQAYRKEHLEAKEFLVFANALEKLLEETEKQEEENTKNLMADFLKDAYYKNLHAINTKGKIDTVIHHQDTQKSAVGVMIENKKINSKEFVSIDDLNKKSFHQLIYYYLKERIEDKNTEVKTLIITNVYQWFIFDEIDFDKYFYQNKKLVKKFEDFQRESGKSTDHFYTQIAKPFVEELDGTINYTYFDLRDYEKELENFKKNFIKKDNEEKYEEIDQIAQQEQKKLIHLYKILSPVHLLKKPFANDSNSLNKDFYNELLHILGLEEVKEQGKKIIKRKNEKEREAGSFLENTLSILERKRVDRIENYKSYGQDDTERLENIALELCITWTNRILFLKLLEAQLLQYHKNEKKEIRQKYKFLNIETIKNFRLLDDLFFGVLAKKSKDRNPILNRFAHIPYLNSSLFEETLLESSSVLISQLSDDSEFTLHSKTILKDGNGIRRKGKETPLNYFFQFLDAYNFSSEGTEEIQKDKKTLINASVLGLIFEKINGYKDGSFYTPSFITMYMCRQTVRQAIVQKFSDEYKMEFESFEHLQDFLKPQYKSIEKLKNNKIFDSIKICDPAVGSGHFLVSALNELIATKQDLNILVDENGNRLSVFTKIENDELIILENEETIFDYKVGNPLSQTIQKTLFHEKQKLIENCLFGVDINSNSVKICRLRLWIELLKHAYYTKESNYTELETLPNLDINIKTGNSLISRFDLDADISKALQKSKWSIDSYRIAVQTYRNATNKEQKYEMEQLIDTIKADFRSEVSKKDPKLVLFSKKTAELQTLLSQTSVFELSKTEQKAKDKTIEKLEKEVLELNQEIEDIKSNKIYQNAFEWRFEFPEVLDKKGNFIGFDIVIGNPPYVDYRMIGKETTDIISHFQTNFQSPRPNLYQYFIERAYQITKQKGYCCYINPNQFLSIDAGFGIRKLLVENTIIHFIDDVSTINVFDEASTYTVVWCFQKIKDGNYLIRISKCKNPKELGEQHLSVRKNEVISNGKYLIVANPYQWLILKIEKDKQKLKNFCEMFWGTSKSGYGKLKIKKGDYLKLNPKQKQEYKPLLQTRDIKHYYIDWKEEYLPKDVFSSIVLKKFEEEEKLVVARLTLQLQAAIDTEQSFVGKSTVIHKINPIFSKKFILVLLNSKLIDFWYKNYFENTHMSGGYIRFDIPYLQKIPIPTISLEEQKPFILLVEQILSLKNQNPQADTSELENEIDDLVYNLYGLNEEEIKIINL